MNETRRRWNAILRVKLMVDGRIANVQYTCRPLEADRDEVTLAADRFVRMLHLAEPEGNVDSDNDFDLWPGEAKTITVTTNGPNFTPVLHWMGKEA